MTKKINKITSSSLENYDLKETYLSIQISLDGFSFCIYHPNKKEYLALEVFEFEETISSPINLLPPIEEIFDNNLLLQQKFEKTIVTHHNELAAIVPKEYFNEDNLSEYLKHNVKVLKTDYIAFDHLTNVSAVSVFIPFVNINNYLFTKYGSFDFNHTSTILVEKLCKLNEDTKQEQLYIHVNDTNFEVICLKDSNLLFYNSFKFQTAEDFIYYILFAIEQLKLNPDTIQTTLLGTIEKESRLFKIIYQYIRNVHFYNEINHKLTKEFTTINKHNYFTALNQF